MFLVPRRGSERQDSTGSGEFRESLFKESLGRTSGHDNSLRRVRSISKKDRPLGIRSNGSEALLFCFGNRGDATSAPSDNTAMRAELAHADTL